MYKLPKLDPLLVLFWPLSGLFWDAGGGLFQIFIKFVSILLGRKIWGINKLKDDYIDKTCKYF